MADNSRIDDLRRRVQKDPASIAFAQLAEECRRAGQFQEAVDVCHAGLQLHPGYLSARVTLGRALIELDDLETALGELTTVLRSAPENLAAIRGVADIHHRRNDLPAALAQYRAALALAKNDPDLQRTVDELALQIEPPPPPAHADGLSFEQIQAEFLHLAPPPVAPAAVERTEPAPAAAESTDAPPAPAEPIDMGVDPADGAQISTSPEDAGAGVPAAEDAAPGHAAAGDTFDTLSVSSEPTNWLLEPARIADASVTPAHQGETHADPPADDQMRAEDAAAESAAARDVVTVHASDTVSASGEAAQPSEAARVAADQIAALERWLDAIHGARAHRGA